MEEALGDFVAIVVSKNSSSRDTGGIGNDGNWESWKNEENPLQGCLLAEISKNHGERKERDQRPNPEQASATSKEVFASWMIFPSLRTGILIRSKDLAATFEAKSCIGKVILSIRTEGIGIIKIRKTRGKRRVLKCSFPRRKRMIPPRTTSRKPHRKKFRGKVS